ncbi:MAG: hypothetical protein AAGK32_07070 [Actinomycetota bacterium]
MSDGTAWHEQPGPVLLLGVVLLVVCGFCVWAWVANDVGIARTVGLLSGGAGIYLVVSGSIALRERAEPAEGTTGEVDR